MLSISKTFTVFLVLFLFSVVFGGGVLANQIDISIATGGVGGVYYPYGGGLAEIWSRHVDGVNAIAEVTAASVENTRLVSAGETLVGAIMNDVAYQAYYATGRFEGNPQSVLGMFQMYPHHYHVVSLAGSGVKSIYDISGHRVSVGAPGSGTEFKTNLVLSALGISYDDFRVDRLSFAEQTSALRDEAIDVGIWDVAAPTSSIMDLAATRNINIISFTEEEIEMVVEEHPFYSPFLLPAGTYDGVDYDVLNPSVWNTVIVTADTPTDLVYELVKAVFAHHDYLVNVHHFATHTTPENAIEHSVIPLHPGAIRYYEEIGLEVPNRLRP